MIQGRLVYLTMLLSSFIALYSSCGPKPKPAPQIEYGVPKISDLKIVENQNETSLSWVTNRQKGVPFGGYDVFIQPLGIGNERESEIDSILSYPGDTSGNIQSVFYPLDDVPPGSVYRAWVVARSIDKRLSSVSDTIEFCPMLRGEIILSLRYSVRTGGFSFAEEKYVPGRFPDNDIIFMAGKEKAKLSSPSRLDPSFRHSDFVDIGPKSIFYTLDDFNPDDYSWQPSVQLIPDHTYLMETADSCYAKMLCTAISGEGGKQNAVFKFVYCPVVNYHRFH